MIIEKIFISAYLEYYKGPEEGVYSGNSYEWIVSVINKIIEKDFKSTFEKLNSKNCSAVTYSLSYELDNKIITIYLVFNNGNKEIGRVPYLSGILGKNHSNPIKLHACKKEIIKIFNELN
ncbi:MAG: hypothetical protein NVV82_17730 [Sporocytophaga sp.]|nr:hypothetical protein [Sporocytophaga sp.]